VAGGPPGARLTRLAARRGLPLLLAALGAACAHVPDEEADARKLASLRSCYAAMAVGDEVDVPAPGRPGEVYRFVLAEKDSIPRLCPAGAAKEAQTCAKPIDSARLGAGVRGDVLEALRLDLRARARKAKRGWASLPLECRGL
jgi:hypothetical protein